jgi:hypothetical protein
MEKRERERWRKERERMRRSDGDEKGTDSAK